MRLDPKDFAFSSRWSNDTRRIAPRMNHGEPSLYKARHASVLSTGSGNYFAKVLHDLATDRRASNRSIRDPLHFPSGYSPVEVQSNRSPRDTTLGKNEIFIDTAQNFVVVVIQIRKWYWKRSYFFKRIEVEDLK